MKGLENRVNTRLKEIDVATQEKVSGGNNSENMINIKDRGSFYADPKETFEPKHPTKPNGE